MDGGSIVDWELASLPPRHWSQSRALATSTPSARCWQCGGGVFKLMMPLSLSNFQFYFSFFGFFSIFLFFFNFFGFLVFLFYFLLFSDFDFSYETDTSILRQCHVCQKLLT